MSELQISALLRENAARVLDRQASVSGTYCIGLEIASTTDDSFRIKISEIQSLTIVQNFLDNYIDDVTVSLKIPTKTYIDLAAHLQDLAAILILKPYDDKTHELLLVAPTIIKFNAMVLDPVDIAQITNIGTVDGSLTSPGSNDAQSSNYMTIQMQLIEPQLYKMRNTKFNGMFRGATVEKLIAYIIQGLGVSTAYIHPIDNIQAIPNLHIPPYKDISNVFDFIQYNYGVYRKGITSYYTGGVMYVYPPYECKPNVDKGIAHIYNIPSGMYSNHGFYHLIEGDQIHVISNTPTKMMDLGQGATEHYGNAVSVVPAENVIDAYVATDDTGSMINDRVSQAIRFDSATALQGNASVLKHGGVTGNPYYEMSKMAFSDAQVLALSWINAIPFTFRPGQPVKYHYDDMKKYTTRNGVIEAIGYSLSNIGRVQSGLLFRCQSHIRLRLSKETSS